MNRTPQGLVPAISAIVPTYNGEQFLRAAIESILNQTFQDFELIVVDDHSNDNTPSILAELEDSRLNVITNERNLGIAAATNKGLALARGKYVALQDHDDISLPHRFQAEVEFLDSHPNAALVGTAASQIDENGSVSQTLTQPTDDLELKWGLLFGCCFHHTSLMIRRSVILNEGGYRDDPSFPFAPDYDLFSRVGERYPVANLPEPLVLWRRHSDNTSLSNAQQQKRSEVVISFRNVCALMDSRPDGPVGTRLEQSGTTKEKRSGRRESASARTAEERYRDFLGLRAFLLTDAGKFPDLPPDQVIAGFRFLADIESTFYKKYSASRAAIAKHRRALNWKSGKHAAALGIRAPWDWRSRLRILTLGLLRLQATVWAALLTPQPRGSRSRDEGLN